MSVVKIARWVDGVLSRIPANNQKTVIAATIIVMSEVFPVLKPYTTETGVAQAMAAIGVFHKLVKGYLVWAEGRALLEAQPAKPE